MCGYSIYWQGTVSTDANGTATMWLMPTPAGAQPYTLKAVPPTDSSFAPFSVSDVVVPAEGTSLVIVLPFVHDPPQTQAALAPAADPTGSYPDPVTVTLTATAFGSATIAATYYELDGGPSRAYTAPFAVTGEGVHHLRYWSVDSDGVFEPALTLGIEIRTTIAGLLALTSGACESGGITKEGICKSLLAKLVAAKSSAGRGQPQAAINQLLAYINELDAQRGKAVTEATYQRLAARAQAVIASLR
jgi:hypothetical protein